MTPERLAQTIQITLFRAIKWRNEGREKHNKYTGALYESSDKIRLSWRGSETCVFFFTSRCRLVPYVLSWVKFFFFVSRTFTFMYNLCIKSRKQLSVGFFLLDCYLQKTIQFYSLGCSLKPKRINNLVLLMFWMSWISLCFLHVENYIDDEKKLLKHKS